MRVSAYDLRQGVIDTNHRMPHPGTARSQGPTTTSSLRKAVRVYHQQGGDGEAARASLRLSLSNYFSQPGAPSTQAAHARHGLETYMQLAALDPRPAFVPRGRVDTELGPDTIASDVDVILLDPQGYAGRLLLFGPVPELTMTQVELLAFAPTAALVEEFDLDNVVGIDVWELRRQRITSVAATRALSRRAEVRLVIDRLLS